MGALLLKPKLEKFTLSDKNEYLIFGLSAMQGWRIEMEDSHSTIVNMEYPFEKWSFFAVFDGHNGESTAKNCSKYLLKIILQTPEFQTMKFDDFGNPKNIGNLKLGIRRGFLKFDEFLRSLPDVVSRIDRSGSTATCAFVTPRYIIFANCGDSRGILIRDTFVHFSTKDHKPHNPEEQYRIEEAGGIVLSDRVNGCLGVSRSLGDFLYKKAANKPPIEQMVSPDPDVTVIEKSETDCMIVLACDGIWDKFTNDELCKYLSSRVLRMEQITEIAEEVINIALFKGSKDNMSIIIIYLKPAIIVDLDLVLEERVLDTLIYNKTENYLKENPNATPTSLLKWFSSVDLPNLPPGGLMAKRYKIEKYLEELKSFASDNVVETPFSLRRRNLSKNHL